jgi:hypothetical protein
MASSPEGNKLSSTWKNLINRGGNPATCRPPRDGASARKAAQPFLAFTQDARPVAAGCRAMARATLPPADLRRSHGVKRRARRLTGRAQAGQADAMHEVVP